MKLEAELEIPILFLVIFRGRHFEKGLEGFKVGPLSLLKLSFLVKKKTAKIWVVSCLW